MKSFRDFDDARSKYDKWLSSFNESANLYEFITEANMIYTDDFQFTMQEILNSPSIGRLIAHVILQKRGKHVDITDNYVDVSGNPNMITFIPDEKVNKDDIIYRATDGTYVINSEHECVKEWGIDTSDCIGNLFSDQLLDRHWKIVATYFPKKYQTLKLFQIQSVDTDEKLLCYCDRMKQGFTPCGTTSTVKPTEVRVGRFVNKFLSAVKDNFTAKEIEDFVNQYQATIQFKNDAFDSFRIVEGEDIRYWYSAKNYANKGGQLGISCMNSEGCQKFFDIYINNPDICKMLIFTQNDKLMGRALLWQLEDGRMYMDRVYTSKDNHMILFNNWAQKNKYISYHTFAGNMKIKLTPGFYDYYPYMDTFAYYAPATGVLSNVEKGFGETDIVIELDSTAGGCSEC